MKQVADSPCLTEVTILRLLMLAYSRLSVFIEVMSSVGALLLPGFSAIGENRCPLETEINGSEFNTDDVNVHASLRNNSATTISVICNQQLF